MISFDIGQSGQSLAFSDSVLEHFNQHRQTRFWHKEAGGLLFARFQLPVIDIDVATGPRRGDRRTRYSYRPDEGAEQREINDMFSRGRHFVGCWHTHPEDIASPSCIDRRNIADCVRRSYHALNGFIMVIVGRNPIPDGMCVSVCDKSSVYELAFSRNAASIDSSLHLPAAWRTLNEARQIFECQMAEI
ncbi:Mov34/MPN/PAD-1 family protein [Mesorhizobium sp. M0894]|uniref:Mov34/MPN/PAD-1 family protein n=1 Tax=unclassified Mesorhizobium TaxID=325217 RepID=UPI003334EDE2